MINVEQIEVWMHGRQVGRLALTPQRPQTCAFEYTAEWLKDGFSISPFELPLTPGLKIAPYKPFDGHFGVFSDSLPDGWGQLILHRHLALQGINSLSLNPLQQLCLVGSNGRGALEYRPDESIRNTQEYMDLAQICEDFFFVCHFKFSLCRFCFCFVFVSLGTKSKSVTSLSSSDRTGRTGGMNPGMLQKLVLLYLTFAENASPFSRFFR